MGKQQEDFKQSGLSYSEFSKHNIVSSVTEKELQKIFPNRDMQATSGIAFTYYRLSDTGQVIPSEYKRYKIYWPPLTGFAASAKDGRPKYLQPANTPNYLYTPPVTDWEAFLQSKESLFVTEGEKKTLAAGERGLPTVGVGGVDSIGNVKRGAASFPELKVLCPGRNVYIVFDIDKGHSALKPEVARAALRLSSEILALGGVPYVVTLPSDGAEKLGLDDWLLTQADRTDLEVLEALTSCAVIGDTAKALYTEAEKVVFINDTNTLGNVSSRQIILVTDYRLSRSNVQVAVRTLGVDRRSGMPQMRTEVRTLGDAFVQWPSRPTAYGITYEPGNLYAITEDGKFNQWVGWAQKCVEEVTEKDIVPLQQAFQALYEESWETMWEWFLLPIARPGVKQVIVPVIQSEIEGIGKSSIPAFFAKFIYGEGPGTPDNAATMNAAALENDRLEFMLNKQFTFIDDANDMHGQKVEALIKNLATTESLTVNPKYIRSYSCPNRVNICITTNRTMPFRIQENDRRFYFPRVASTVLPQLWDALHKWGRAGGGGKVIRYAQTVWKHDHIDPYRRAPMTNEKRAIVEMAMSGIGEYLRHLVEQAQEGKLNRVVATAGELKRLMITDNVEDDVRKIANWPLKNAIVSAGGKPYRAVQVKVDGKTHPVYVLHNVLLWENKPPSDIAREILRCPLKGPYKAEKGKKYEQPS